MSGVWLNAENVNADLKHEMSRELESVSLTSTKRFISLNNVTSGCYTSLNII